MGNHTILFVDEFVIHVTRKHIKGIYLRVLPPDGKVTVSAPVFCSDDLISNFILEKKSFIKKALNRIKDTEQPQIEYLSGDRVPILGKNYTLVIREGAYSKPFVKINQDDLELYIHHGSNCIQRENAIYQCYSDWLKQVIDPLVSKWESAWGVKISRYTFRRQKTIWGSCNRRTRSISFNIEMIKYPIACIDYIVAHELLHINIPGHGADFKAEMTAKLPNWYELRSRLKEAPVRGGF